MAVRRLATYHSCLILSSAPPAPPRWHVERHRFLPADHLHRHHPPGRFCVGCWPATAWPTLPCISFSLRYVPAAGPNRGGLCGRATHQGITRPTARQWCGRPCPLTVGRGFSLPPLDARAYALKNAPGSWPRPSCPRRGPGAPAPSRSCQRLRVQPGSVQMPHLQVTPQPPVRPCQVTQSGPHQHQR
jgi:hypothetical protein